MMSRSKFFHHRRFWTRWSLVANIALGISMALLSNSAAAVEQDKSQPTEAVGSISPSIHTPPVRNQPPARTRFIERPAQYDPTTTARKQTLAYRLESLRLAIEDLINSYGERYPGGPEFLARWHEVSQACRKEAPNAESLFAQLRNDALLANPLLNMDRMLVLKRKQGQLGLPTNHQCNTSLKQQGYNNELAILSPIRPTGTDCFQHAL